MRGQFMSMINQHLENGGITPRCVSTLGSTADLYKTRGRPRPTPTFPERSCDWFDRKEHFPCRAFNPHSLTSFLNFYCIYIYFYLFFF
ncbi:Uncharacterized protein APZ42_023040 [Daphnia magna]|uniref:Uncharacterized protein n=1 Tax=Daphnia magna TaxID=35525 RepID=A0A164V9M2_9CRUS|nr:Uncharacterized protein APZ42_023040 [Daphnia magna]